MFVRLADARRDDELHSDVAQNKLVRQYVFTYPSPVVQNFISVTLLLSPQFVN